MECCLIIIIAQGIGIPCTEVVGEEHVAPVDLDHIGLSAFG